MSKGLNALNDLREVRGYNDTEYNKRLDIIETELKALEIIKNKDINLIKLKFSANYEEYETGYILDYPRGNHITKQEYDLLKEVIL